MKTRRKTVVSVSSFVSPLSVWSQFFFYINILFSSKFSHIGGLGIRTEDSKTRLASGVQALFFHRVIVCFVLSSFIFNKRVVEQFSTITQNVDMFKIYVLPRGHSVTFLCHIVWFVFIIRREILVSLNLLYRHRICLFFFSLVSHNRYNWWQN